MRDLRHHPADLGTVRVLDGVVDAPEPERAERAALLGLRPDRRTHLGDPQRRHDQATSVASVLRALRSRYARSIPRVDTSSGDLPRSLATASGRRNVWRPLIVARDTLIAFDEPSDLAST